MKKNVDQKEQFFFKPRRSASSFKGETKEHVDTSGGNSEFGIPIYSVSGMHRDVILAIFPSIEAVKSEESEPTETPSKSVESYTLPFLTVFCNYQNNGFC